MAVVCESSAGWLLDELTLINKWYECSGGLPAAPSALEEQKKTGIVYKMKEELFKLVKPYFSLCLPDAEQAATHDKQDTSAPTGSKVAYSPFNLHLTAKDESAAQCDAHDNSAPTCSNVAYTPSENLPQPAKGSDREDNSAATGCKAVKKKRKRATALNQGELDALEYHQKICDLILKRSQVLIQEGLMNGLLHAYSHKEEQNYKMPSEVCVRSSNLSELCNMTKELSSLGDYEHIVNIICSDQQSSESMDWLSRITENSSEWPQVIHLMGEKYLIPPKASFLLSDISCMEPLLHYKKYDVIVIDPPWENKSVKRSKRYNYLSTLEIKQLPIPDLAAPNCLVITWVTNRQKHLRFVKEELYPHWSVRPLAEWHWVKITQSGEFVFPMESAHKKPYEILVLGCLMNDMGPTAREPDMDLHPISQHKIIVSVPCNLHSHKPSLSEVLKKYVKPDAECLELFARNLQPGWTSWGNEVLKFQHMDYFIPLEAGK